MAAPDSVPGVKTGPGTPYGDIWSDPRLTRAQKVAAATALANAHDCGDPGRPVTVARCENCWDAEDEAYFNRNR